MERMLFSIMGLWSARRGTASVKCLLSSQESIMGANCRTYRANSRPSLSSKPRHPGPGWPRPGEVVGAANTPLGKRCYKQTILKSRGGGWSREEPTNLGGQVSCPSSAHLHRSALEARQVGPRAAGRRTSGLGYRAYPALDSRSMLSHLRGMCISGGAPDRTRSRCGTSCRR